MSTSFDEMRQERIDDLKDRYERGVIEKANLEFLTKLIEQADDINEVDKIMEMGIIYRRTGLNFDKKLERVSDSIKYLQKNEDLSFDNGGGITRLSSAITMMLC